MFKVYDLQSYTYAINQTSFDNLNGWEIEKKSELALKSKIGKDFTVV